MSQGKRTEYKALAIVVCAALSAQQVQQLVVLAQAALWDVWVVATPNALKFIDEPLLEQLTGHAVTVEDSPTSPPLALPLDAAVVVPATFNTLKKWAAGSVDTFALHLLASWDAQKMPVLAVPRASAELAQEPDFSPALELIQARGVAVLYEPDSYPPNNNVPWDVVLATLHQLCSIYSS